MPAYTNPIVAENCPDPSVFRDERTGAYYLLCTTNANQEPAKFPIRRSHDLVSWERVGHAFPEGQVPAWATEDFWAPEVHRVGDRLVLYYTARDTTGRLCLGAATADAAEGPWVDLGRPMLRDDRVGMIDSHLFRDADGTQYLYWKADYNAFDPPEPTPIFVQELAAGGLERVGEPTTALVNDLPWEGTVVEGPWVVARDGYYYLFYAANTFNSDRYATGVARSRSPQGPFEKWPEPILASNQTWWGPGHGCVVSTGARDLFVYHAWQAARVDAAWNQSVYPRMALLDPIEWRDGWPSIGTPSSAAGSF